MDSAIVKINASDYGLEESKAKLIEQAFKPMIDKMVNLEEEFNQIIKLPITSETCQQAHDLRLKYVKVRTGTAAIHTKVKAFYRAGGLFVDGWKNAQLFASQGLEDKLRGIEDHYKNIEKDRIAKLQEERSNALIPYNPGFIPESLGSMQDEVWSNYFNGVKLAYNERIKAEQKAEEERIARQKAEAEERQRIREENEQLKEDAAERERLEAIERGKREKAEATRKRKMERERKAFQAKLNKESKERERVEAVRRKKEDNERKILYAKVEKERKEKEEAKREFQAKLQKEIKERERLEAENLKKEEEEQARKDAEAAEIKKAELAPDVEKLDHLAWDICRIVIPECRSDIAVNIARESMRRLETIAKYIKMEEENIK